METPYSVVVWWLWRTQQILPAESIYKLPAKLAQTILLLEKEVTSHESQMHDINSMFAEHHTSHKII